MVNFAGASTVVTFTLVQIVAVPMELFQTLHKTYVVQSIEEAVNATDVILRFHFATACITRLTTDLKVAGYVI